MMAWIRADFNPCKRKRADALGHVCERKGACRSIPRPTGVGIDDRSDRDDYGIGPSYFFGLTDWMISFASSIPRMASLAVSAALTRVTLMPVWSAEIQKAVAIPEITAAAMV